MISSKATALLAAMLAFACALLGCQNPGRLQNEKNMSLEQIVSEAQSWLEIEGVEGVGQGEKDGKGCIYVLVSGEPGLLQGKVPDVFMGVPVYLMPTGKIEPQD